MTHRLLMCAVVLVLLGNATAAWTEPREKQDSAPISPQQDPLVLYLAKGEADACGVGCSEWIAAEGSFDRDAAHRMRVFLKRHGDRKLPLYFNSPGGLQLAALDVGRQLRERGMTVGVAKTIPRGCTSASDKSDACRVLKRSGQPVLAEWRPDAYCTSGCVYALLGGKVRHVPPSARLGVHSSRLAKFAADGRMQKLPPEQLTSQAKVEKVLYDAQIRSYVREMGIDGGLFDLASKVPHEKFHFLSRDEIAAFGIDRREFEETRWLVGESSSDRSVFVGKAIVEARGEDRKEYRTSHLFLSCSDSRRAVIFFWRGLSSAEVGKPVTVVLAMGNHRVDLPQAGTASRVEALDPADLFAKSQGYALFDAFEAAPSGTINVVVTDPFATTTPRITKLSTQGLTEGIKMLREKCV